MHCLSVPRRIHSLRDGKRYDEATQAYDRALQIDPDYPEAWEGLGDALLALGRGKEAEAAHARAEELAGEPVSSRQ